MPSMVSALASGVRGWNLAGTGPGTISGVELTRPVLAQVRSGVALAAALLAIAVLRRRRFALVLAVALIGELAIFLTTTVVIDLVLPIPTWAFEKPTPQPLHGWQRAEYFPRLLPGLSAHLTEAQILRLRTAFGA